MKALLLLVLILLYINPLYAATISLTSPTTSAIYKEADDYFTDVQNDPLDFDKRRDIMWEEGYDEASISLSNNEWNGTTSRDSATYTFLVFQGIVGANNIGRTGENFPIDTTKYKHVSTIGQYDNRQYNALYWSRTEAWPALVDNLTVAEIDGYSTSQGPIYHSADELILKDFDLTNNTDWTSANITGLIFDASFPSFAITGSKEKHKWFRVYDATTGSNVIINWNIVGLPAGSPKVEVYVDTNNIGFDGAKLTRVNASDNTYTFNTGALPPGDYYFYTKLYSNQGTDRTSSILATSGYSAKITINGKPQIKLNNPSYTSGDDYATKELANAWDMNSNTDIQQTVNVNNSIFSNGIYSAQSIGNDPRVHFNVSGSKPINPSKYKYLTYSLEMDPSRFGNINHKVANGWVVRVFWWANNISSDGSTSNDFIVYEGQHSYSVDLSQPNLLETIGISTAQLNWGVQSIKNIRLDPNENTLGGALPFWLYDIKLTAEPTPDANHNFTVSFELSDPENNNSNIAFYLDNNNSGFNGSLIGTKAFNVGTRSYTFDACGNTVGSYYLYYKATDSFGNISQHYAEVPINITQATICQNKTDILDLYMMGVLPTITQP